MDWLNTLKLEDDGGVVLRDLLGEVEHQLQRKGQLTKALQEVAMHERYATRVGLLRCFRGIELVTAMTIVASGAK